MPPPEKQFFSFLDAAAEVGGRRRSRNDEPGTDLAQHSFANLIILLSQDWQKRSVPFSLMKIFGAREQAGAASAQLGSKNRKTVIQSQAVKVRRGRFWI